MRVKQVFDGLEGVDRIFEKVRAGTKIYYQNWKKKREIDQKLKIRDKKECCCTLLTE